VKTEQKSQILTSQH